MMMPKLWLEVTSRVKGYHERMDSFHRQRSSIGVWSADTGTVRNNPSDRRRYQGADCLPVRFRTARYEVVRHATYPKVW